MRYFLLMLLSPSQPVIAPENDIVVVYKCDVAGCEGKGRPLRMKLRSLIPQNDAIFGNCVYACRPHTDKAYKLFSVKREVRSLATSKEDVFVTSINYNGTCPSKIDVDVRVW